MKHVLSLLVENKFGVLQRVTGLISRRGFNIESLAVAPTEDPTMSRMTIVLIADELGLQQVTKQLNKLVSVFKVHDLTRSASLERELALFKVATPSDKRHEVIEIAQVFDAKVIDVTRDALIIEMVGTQDQIDNMEDLLKGYGIRTMARTGMIAIARDKD